MTTDITKSTDITRLVSQRDYLVAELIVFIDRYWELDTLFKEVHSDGLCNVFAGNMVAVPPAHSPWFHTQKSKQYATDTTSAIDARFWLKLEEVLKLEKVMPTSAYSQWRGQMYQGANIPAFTLENIRATMIGLYENREQMLVDEIITMFKRLSWNYKANSPVLLGEKIITRYVRDRSWNPSKQTGDDLHNLFHLLEFGQLPVDTTSITKALTKDTEADTPYMGIKTYLNGNAHIKFKRMDLVEKFNKAMASKYPNALAFEPEKQSRKTKEQRR